MATWRKCSSCKNDIPLGATYWVCSVSTCRGNATNYAFCSIACWDAHVPTERHRPDSAGAIEKKAPMTPGADADPKRRIIVGAGSAPAGSAAPARAAAGASEDDVLVVASKIRKYISDKSGLNTSASLYDALSAQLRRLCDLAIESARSDGRKTVMDRDVR